MRRLIAYSFFPFVIICVLTFSFCIKKKNKPGSEFTGKWINSTTTLTIKSNGSGEYSYYSGGVSKSASGTVQVKGNEMKVGIKKFKLDAHPTEISTGNGIVNTYIVLDKDTLYKDPYKKASIDPCKDGIRNNGETQVDCGGNCEPCETCTDGIMNQNETGVDCGGVCDPCTTNACSTELGFTEGVPFTSGKKAISGMAYYSQFDSSIYIGLSSYPGVEYRIEFDKGTFFDMPVGTSRFAIIGDNFDKYYEPNRYCTVIFNISGKLYAPEESKRVYFTRTDQNTYNIKFCLLETYINSTTTSFISANANFTLN